MGWLNKFGALPRTHRSVQYAAAWSFARGPLAEAKMRFLGKVCTLPEGRILYRRVAGQQRPSALHRSQEVDALLFRIVQDAW